MANIPVIGEGSVTEHPTPVVPEATPPLSAYGGQVGASVEMLSAEVGRISHEEKQKTNEVRALRAETDYQEFVNKTVYDIHSGFSSLHGEQALAKSEEVKDQIYRERERILTGLNSRYAQRLTAVNTQRILRFAENHVDSHAGMQRRGIDDQTFNKYLFTSTQTLANNAAAKGEYNPTAADEVLSDMQQAAYAKAGRMGLPQEAADDFAEKSVSMGVDVLLGTLAHTGNEKAREEFDRWGDYLSPNKRVSVETALTAHDGKQAAAKLVYNAPRLNFARGGEADPDGPINELKVHTDLLKQAKEEKWSDEKLAQVGKMVDQLLVEEDKNLDRARKAHISQIMADGRTVDGTFQMDRQKSSDQIEWMKRNAPGGPGNKPGLREIEATERRDDKQAEKTNNEASLKALRSELIHKLADDPQAFSKMTLTDLQDMVLDEKYQFNSTGERQAQNMLKSMQSSPKIKLLQTVPTHVETNLRALFGKDEETRKIYNDELISELSEAMVATDKKEWDDTTISSFIHHAFDKKAGTGGIFTSDKFLVDLRMKAREQQRKQGGSGRLPVRVLRNTSTGEVKVIYGTD